MLFYIKKQPGAQDNFLVAKNGIMKVTPDKRFLEFTLKDGWNYQENGNRFQHKYRFYTAWFCRI